MKKHKIKIQVWNVTLTVLIGGNEKEFVKEMKKLGEDMLPDGREGCSLYIQNKETKEIKHWIIWMKKKEQGTAIHEAFHFVSDMMAYKNAHLIEDQEFMYIGRSQESWAYLLEYVYREIMKLK